MSLPFEGHWQNTSFPTMQWKRIKGGSRRRKRKLNSLPQPKKTSCVCLYFSTEVFGASRQAIADISSYPQRF